MNAEQIAEAVSGRHMTQAEAVRQLVALGYNEEVAREEIFIALGGDDVLEDGARRAGAMRSN